jgi:hypothetical protein
MDWARILAYVTGTVDQELLLRNEYLAAENRILRAQLKGQFFDLTATATPIHVRSRSSADEMQGYATTTCARASLRREP